MDVDTDKIVGSILASAMGDALGAAYEGGVVEKVAWKIIGTRQGKCRWTDDTQMSIDIAQSLLAWGEVNQDDIARRFADSYEWSRGYGPGAAKILTRIKNGMPWAEANRSVYKDGSYGNGAAMRVGPVGLFFANHDSPTIIDAARKTAVITHAHPMGIEGAVVIALATAMALNDVETPQIMSDLIEEAEQETFCEKVEIAAGWLRSTTIRDVNDVRAQLGNGIAAQNSAVTAVYSALSHRNQAFENLLLFIRELGGDVDTIGAMAGAIWGAARGANDLPNDLLAQVEGRNTLHDLAQRFALFALSK